MSVNHLALISYGFLLFLPLLLQANGKWTKTYEILNVEKHINKKESSPPQKL